MIIRAKYLIRHDMAALENAAIRIDNGRIAEIGTPREIGGIDDTDLGECVLLPGFVNAHTHLELSFAAGRVPPTRDFTDWLRRLLTVIRGVDDFAVFARSVEDGLRESIRAGTTLLGDITRRPDITRPTVASFPSAPAVVSFGEVIALGTLREKAEIAMKAACDTTHAHDNPASAISPHAPYTVEPDVLARCVRCARARHFRICVHAAETEDEMRFLLDGDGPLRDFFKESGVWTETMSPAGCRSIEYLDRAGALGHETLLAHANYVNDEEIDRLAATGAHVAYCPRTHSAFGHPPHPFPRMLARGVNVCLGTDSLASNPSLSILDEMRHIRRLFPEISAALILSMGTAAGAEALGRQGLTGSLRPGLRADLVVVPLDPHGPDDPLTNVLDGSQEASACFTAGTRQDGGSRHID
jgi:cytosine/adenosine deaminase-related metal-dependent hydrolase